MRVDQRRRRRRARRRSGSKRRRARGEPLAVARQLEARVDAVADRRRRGRRRRGWRGAWRDRSTPSSPNAQASGSSPSPRSASSAAKRGPSGRNARPTMRSARLGSRPCRNRTTGVDRVDVASPRATGTQSTRFVGGARAARQLGLHAPSARRARTAAGTARSPDRPARPRPQPRRVLAQEAGQVRRRRVRRVELGHRRRDEEDAHRGPPRVAELPPLPLAGAGDSRSGRRGSTAGEGIRGGGRRRGPGRPRGSARPASRGASGSRAAGRRARAPARRGGRGRCRRRRA